MLRGWINWMPVKLWLLLKYLARHEFLERRRFKDFSVWSCETWIQSLSCKIPSCLWEVSQNQLNYWDWAELTVPLGSESKYEMLIQSWASWVALDTPLPPHFYFFNSSKFHGLVPYTQIISVIRGLGSPGGSTLPACSCVSTRMPCTGFVPGKWIIPSSAAAFFHGDFAPAGTGPLEAPWGGWCSWCEHRGENKALMKANFTLLQRKVDSTFSQPPTGHPPFPYARGWSGTRTVPTNFPLSPLWVPAAEARVLLQVKKAPKGCKPLSPAASVLLPSQDL